MPLDPDVEILLSSMEQNGEGAGSIADVGVEQARQFIEVFGTIGGTVEVARVEDHTVPGPGGDIPVRLYSPSADAVLPVVVYLHGGGWCIGNIASHDGICRKLAAQSGLTVVSVDYRLAPEHRFPCAPEDCYAAVQWVPDQAGDLRVDASRMALAGDSAGGNLTAVTALLARDRGGPAISFQLMMYPVIDATMSFPSFKENAEGKLLSARDMAFFYEQYVGDDVDLKDPMLSPLYAPSLRGLPPALVITAEYDPLRDEGEAYADALQQAGVEARSSRYDGMVHGFFGLEAVIPAAAPAMEEAAAALAYWLK
ncbi:MAG: alpha/beta hydrolase [Acidimicrobiia bacterium]|nr:alpha/beta hydrolase [Acidimicrobiia bacterium]